MDFSFFFFGTKLFGKVDRLSNGAYVACLFHHICGLPLVYQGTFLVVGRDGREFRGIALPISWKSILFAYLRAALYVLLFSGLVAPIIAVMERSVSAFNFFFMSIPMALVGLFITYWLGLPNPERKQELQRIGSRSAGLY